MLLACRTSPVALAFGATSIPVATALIAAAFSARLGGGALARPAAHRAYWALGFACFAAGAAAEAYGASYGWSPVTFRIYYLAGGVLAVGLLGLGATCLHARRDVALLMTGAILATARPRRSACSAAASTARSSPRAACARRRTTRSPATRSSTPSRSTPSARWRCSAGIVRSLVRRERPVANILIGAGVLVVASSGTLTRIGDAYGIVLGAQLVGLVMIYAGFELATQRLPLRRAARAHHAARRRLTGTGRTLPGQRGVAQPGRAPRLGRGGRPFESARPDRRRRSLAEPREICNVKAAAGWIRHTIQAYLRSPLAGRADPV